MCGVIAVGGLGTVQMGQSPNFGEQRRKGHTRRVERAYAALDLGSNNCRLLIASHIDFLLKVLKPIAKSKALRQAA